LIHAAAITNGDECASVPTRVAAVNGEGVSRVCDAARLLPNLQRIVLLSSGLVYGRQSFQEPQIAETHPGGTGLFDAKDVYAASKRFAETVAASYISECKLPITVARPFAFVGPYQPLHLPWAVTDFIRDAIHGGPIRIMGDGTTVRSLMYGSDFAYGILALAVRGRVRETYNIGSPHGIDLLTLARKIAAFFAPAPEIKTCLGQLDHPSTTKVPSTAKVEAELGFKMTLDLDAALERAIAWHKASALSTLASP
jgi:dTDP-glucose 4,6-dehydratase